MSPPKARSISADCLKESDLSSQYARSLIEASLDPLVTISPDGKITDVNEATIKVTGVVREQLIGSDFSNYFTEPEKAREGYQQVFAKGFVTDYPLTIRHKDGRLTDVLYNASVYKDARGNVLGVFAAARDVTERKRVESDLRRLSSIVESSEDAIIAKDLHGIITNWNRSAEKMFGYTAQEAIGRSVALVIPPEKSDEELLLLEKVGHGEPVQQFETERVRKDGTRMLVSLSLSPIKDLSGQIVGVSSIKRDVTERKKVEEKLRVASAYARSLIEASLDPLVTISPDGKITDVNEATIKVTGVVREQLIGSDFSIYFTEPDKAREGYQQVFANGFVTDYPLTIRHKDGRLTDVLYNASVYQDMKGNVLGVFAAARDITAQKQAETELTEQRSRELVRLAELERFQKLTVGRELKMIQLKKEIEELKARGRKTEQ